MWYRFGSLDETPGKTGLAHALEHMMFRGTHAISGGGLDDIAARLGATVNANTTEDYTHFYMVLPSDRLDLAIHIEADRMRGLLLRGQDWQLERGAVLSEIDNDNSQPVFASDARRARRRVSEFTLRAHRARRARRRRAVDRGGSARLLQPMVRAERRRRSSSRATYRRPPCSRRRTATSAPFRVGATAEHAPLPAQSATPPVTLHRDADYPYPVVDLAYRIPGDLDRDAAATQILENVFNSERSAFYRDLVLSKLALGYNAYADTALHAGIFTCCCS